MCDHEARLDAVRFGVTDASTDRDSDAQTNVRSASFYVAENCTKNVKALFEQIVAQ